MYYTYKMYSKTKIVTINLTSTTEVTTAAITFSTITTTLLGCL